MPGATPRYTPEFRAEAVRLVRSSPDKSIVQSATELGISDSSLHNWLKQSQIDAGQREGLTTEEREELRRLRKENKVLRQERDILKKPRSSSPERTGVGELLQAHRCGEDQLFRLYAMQGFEGLKERLLLLERQAAFEEGHRECCPHRADQGDPPQKPRDLRLPTRPC